MQLFDFIANLGIPSIKRKEMPADIRRQIAMAQMDLRARLAPRMAVTGAVVALALSWSFWNHGDSPLMRIAFGGVFASYFTLILTTRLWWLEQNRIQRFGLFQLVFCCIPALIGISWSLVLIEGLGHADLVQTSTLYALAVGLMSAPAFTGPAVYALALWIPITVGSLIALLVDSPTPPVPSLVGLFSYAFLTFTSILSVNRDTIDRELKRIEAQLQSEVIGLLLRDFEEGSSDWLWETDASLGVARPSARFAEVAGKTLEQMTSMSLTGFLREHGSAPDDGAADALIGQIGRFEPFRDRRVALRLGGELRWWSLTGKPVFGADGRFAGYRGVGSDVTEYRRAEQKIAFIANHDSLTGFANRLSFDDALKTVCANPGPKGAALLCLDLDHFKTVNDSFGHKMGDILLVAVAKRVAGSIRTADLAFRLGGDEFAVILPASERGEAMAVAERIVARLASPFQCNGISVRIGACVGIAEIGIAGAVADEVHHEADLALYRAKTEGRATYRLFDPERDKHAELAQELNFEMNNALDDRAFLLDYQPIAALDTGRITSVEALIRWNHPRYGVLGPDRFVAIAEQSGAIIPIGARAIDMACAFAATLPEPVAVSVNLSPVQLHDPALIAKIAAALARNRVRPERIEFELTETTLLDMSAHIVAILREIKALGCRLGLDDFGSGYSSVATLYYFQFDTLKIDRSLLLDAANDPRRRKILGNIVRLAKDIGLAVTGEGAETEEHMALLRALGFDNAQGFKVCPPLRDAEMLEWLAAPPSLDCFAFGSQ